MPESNPQPFRGGRSRPPLCYDNLCLLTTGLPAVLFAASLVFMCLSAVSQPPPDRQKEEIRRARRQAAGAPNRLHPGEMRARALMKVMLKPKQQYKGVQKTEIFGGAGVTSVQEVEGDTNGFVRVTFRSPANVEGDVMFIGPGSFHSYHRATRTMEWAPWPTDWNDEGKRMFANLMNGTVNAWINGHELIADRQAAIVVLTVPNGAAGAGRILRKLWIDEETGILLKIQKMNPEGHPISTTTMETITVNPTMPINPNDFKPLVQFPGATVTPLFPEPQYHTMQDAQGHLPITPLEPGSIPASFRLDGVWGFGPDREHPFLHSVLLRYTDGVASFSLYERLIPPAKQTPIEQPPLRMFGRNQQNWRFQTPQGEINVQYIGHLSPQQAQALYESLR